MVHGMILMTMTDLGHAWGFEAYVPSEECFDTEREALELDGYDFMDEESIEIDGRLYDYMGKIVMK